MTAEGRDWREEEGNFHVFLAPGKITLVFPNETSSHLGDRAVSTSWLVCGPWDCHMLERVRDQPVGDHSAEETDGKVLNQVTAQRQRGKWKHLRRLWGRESTGSSDGSSGHQRRGRTEKEEISSKRDR